MGDEGRTLFERLIIHDEMYSCTITMHYVSLYVVNLNNLISESNLTNKDKSTHCSASGTSGLSGETIVYRPHTQLSSFALSFYALQECQEFLGRPRGTSVGCSAAEISKKSHLLYSCVRHLAGQVVPTWYNEGWGFPLSLINKRDAGNQQTQSMKY
jgi:hypothetical protein